MEQMFVARTGAGDDLGAGVVWFARCGNQAAWNSRVTPRFDGGSLRRPTEHGLKILRAVGASCTVAFGAKKAIRGRLSAGGLPNAFQGNRGNTLNQSVALRRGVAARRACRLASDPSRQSELLLHGLGARGSYRIQSRGAQGYGFSRKRKGLIEPFNSNKGDACRPIRWLWDAQSTSRIKLSKPAGPTYCLLRNLTSAQPKYEIAQSAHTGPYRQRGARSADENFQLKYGNDSARFIYK